MFIIVNLLAHQLPLDHPDNFDAVTDNEEIVHVKCEDDDDSVVLVGVHARVELERLKYDSDQDGIYGIKSVPGALCQPVESLPELNR